MNKQSRPEAALQTSLARVIELFKCTGRYA